MTRRPRFRPAPALAALVASAVLAWHVLAGHRAAEGRPPEPPAPGAAAPVASSARGDVFPVVARDPLVRTYQCAGLLWGRLDVSFGPQVKLPSGEYVVMELRQQHQTYGREWLRSDATGVYCGQREEGSVASVLDPPQPLLVLPLEAGKRWAWKGSASGLPCESESVVVGREKVAVPYGTVEECWRVDTTTRGRAGDRLERSLWFAPGIGLVQEVSRIESQGRAVSVVAKLERVGEPEPASRGPGAKPRRRS